ncbi:MAG: hypothetical protein HYX84_03800 [Chloroflexi bacterium]|nr:hypothetical protein [Chloroflexota bacterium]
MVLSDSTDGYRTFFGKALVPSVEKEKDYHRGYPFGLQTHPRVIILH